jgi:hypothetical protein
MRGQDNNKDQRLLLVAAQAGDEGAFRRLVEPYRRALDRFEPRVQLQTWLYRIATNACLDELERRLRRPEPLDPFPDQPSDEAATPIAGDADRELLGRHIDAFEHDDMDGLVALLQEDAILRMPPEPSVLGAVAVVTFFRERAARGDLSRMRLTPTRANGRPAVVVQRRSADGGLEPHGALVLEVGGDRIAGIDAFIEPSLLPRFGFPRDDRERSP